MVINRQNEINFLQWNSQGIVSKSSDLKNLLSYNNISIALLSETFLESKHTFIVHNYHVERCDRLPNQSDRNTRGGTAILVRSDLTYERINVNSHPKCEVVCVKLHLAQNKILYIASVYAKPKHRIKRDEWFDIIANFNDGSLIIGGDFNAHHIAWDSTFTHHCYEGDELFSFIEGYNLAIENDDTPTRVHRPGWRDSIIDLTIVSTDISLDTSNWRVCSDSCGSDHYPIVYSIGNVDPKVSHCNINKRNYKKVNWSLYTQLVEDKSERIVIRDNHSINETYEKFHSVVQDATETCVIRENFKKVTPKKIKPPWWDTECNRMVAMRRRSLTRFNYQKNLDNYLAYKKEAAKTKKYFLKRKCKEFQNFTSTLRPGIDSRIIWQKVKGIKNPSKTQKPVIIDSKWIESFVNKLCPTIEVEVRKKANRLVNEDLDKSITLNEINIALEHNKNTSVGYDELHYDSLRKLPKIAKENMLLIFNKIFDTGYCPDAWKTHIIVPILKPGKPSDDPHSYRPISLLSCVGKTFERIIHRRLEWYVENQRLLPIDQYGGRKMRSVQDCLNMLNLKIQETYAKNHYFAVAFLDIQGAYDNVNLEMLYNELVKNRVSKKTCEWIYNYYKNRKFFVRTENAFVYKRDSANRSINSGYQTSDEGLIGPFLNSKGLCQGSVLSGLLYILYVAGLEKRLQNNYTILLQFVDDLTLGCTGATLDTAKRRLQNKLNILHIMLNKLQLNISIDKCKIVIFTRHRVNWCPIIKMGGNNIKIVQNAKLLGVWFDQKSIWERQILEIINKCQKGINLLKILCGVSWGAHPITLLNIYKAIIRSHFDYSSMLISTATDTRLKRLETTQYKALRLILGQLKSSPIHILNYESLELPLKHRRIFLSSKYYIKRLGISELHLHSQLSRNSLLANKSYYNHKKKPLLVKLHRKYSTLSIDVTDMANYFKSELVCKNILINCDDFSFRKSDFQNDKYFKMYIRQENPDFCIYTDGSVDRERKLSSYGIYNENNNDKWGYKINKITSSWQVEILAISEALKYLLSRNYTHQNVFIITDSKSAVQSLKINSFANNNKKIVIEVKNVYIKLKSKGNNIKLVWVPGHQGITGNEIADGIARDALINGQLYENEIYDSEDSIILNIKKNCENQFISWYSERGKVIGAEFCANNHDFPKVRWFDTTMWRKLIVTIGRIRCGHGQWPQHLYKIGLKSDPLCTCGEEGEKNHVLLACPHNNNQLLFNKIAPIVKTFPVNSTLLTSNKKLCRILYRYIITEEIKI